MTQPWISKASLHLWLLETHCGLAGEAVFVEIYQKLGSAPHLTPLWTSRRVHNGCYRCIPMGTNSETIHMGVDYAYV